MNILTSNVKSNVFYFVTQFLSALIYFCQLDLFSLPEFPTYFGLYIQWLNFCVHMGV